jgi:hypothetical protein
MDANEDTTQDTSPAPEGALPSVNELADYLNAQLLREISAAVKDIESSIDRFAKLLVELTPASLQVNEALAGLTVATSQPATVASAPRTRTHINEDQVHDAVAKIALGQISDVSQSLLGALRRRGLASCEGRGTKAQYSLTESGWALVEELTGTGEEAQ